MKKKKEKKNNWLIIILSVILIISIILVYTSRPLAKERIPASFIYSDTTGFEVRTDELTFGALVKNQSASRNITVINDHEIPIKINVRAKGEIKNFIIVSENNINLSPNEVKNITFIVNPGNNLTEFRRYEGFIELITWIA